MLFVCLLLDPATSQPRSCFSALLAYVSEMLAVPWQELHKHAGQMQSALLHKGENQPNLSHALSVFSAGKTAIAQEEILQTFVKHATDIKKVAG